MLIVFTCSVVSDSKESFIDCRLCANLRGEMSLLQASLLQALVVDTHTHMRAEIVNTTHIVTPCVCRHTHTHTTNTSAHTHTYKREKTYSVRLLECVTIFLRLNSAQMKVIQRRVGPRLKCVWAVVSVRIFRTEDNSVRFLLSLVCVRYYIAHNCPFRKVSSCLICQYA